MRRLPGSGGPHNPMPSRRPGRRNSLLQSYVYKRKHGRGQHEENSAQGRHGLRSSWFSAQLNDSSIVMRIQPKISDSFRTCNMTSCAESQITHTALKWCRILPWFQSVRHQERSSPAWRVPGMGVVEVPAPRKKLSRLSRISMNQNRHQVYTVVQYIGLLNS